MADLSRDPDCAALRLEITETLMLGLPLSRRTARHLTTCPECSAGAESARQVVAAFEAAGSGAAAGPSRPSPSADLRDLVLRGVRGARSARRVTVVVAAVFVTTCGLAAVALLAPPADSAAGGRVSVSRTGPLMAASWGTRIPVVLTGLREGRVYTVETYDAAGHHAVAGSVRGGPGRAPTVRVVVVTAMARGAVAGLLVEDDRGREVARAAIG